MSRLVRGHQVRSCDVEDPPARLASTGPGPLVAHGEEARPGRAGVEVLASGWQEIHTVGRTSAELAFCWMAVAVWV